ncbi:uncharacterized protein N7479_002672 [Penicillium vulpinum]|uniref:F-box domain-containing protein n=1 Tax=Penicillium vulpinum TaxID=29845 RepID=A0A1V6RU56_9EURO|nr:uncharacterized protein N7479_002672 [Penicillium vulpinum]KAJ5972754.1 hypothetical protein N7479_002672 [Penicillium vulpinum]OQE05034.1 hypothetical protein PENVUL_c027G02036 [Penicillium vulpinum]
MEALPIELLRKIVSHLDDCTSLYNLLRASPAIFGLFDHEGLQLTRAVFSQDTMCDQIRESISLMALLDSYTFPYPTLDVFIASFVHLTVKGVQPQRADDPVGPLLPNDLPDNTPIPKIRRILSIYAQIVHLTEACLDHYLEKFNALRPENIVDTETRYSKDFKKTPPWTQRFESFKVPVTDHGPIVWEEEQRVSRALWRIQLFYDLRTAANQSQLRWPAEDVTRLQTMKERDLFVKWGLCYEAEEIHTVNEYLDHAWAANLVFFHDPTNSSSGGCNRDSRRLPFLRHPVERRWPMPRRPSPEPVTQTYKIDFGTFGMQQWQRLSEMPFSPLRTVNFDSYRRLGVAFWCLERFQAIGLIPLNGEGPGASINLTLWQFAWRSILDPLEVVEVEKKLQTEWEEREPRD